MEKLIDYVNNLPWYFWGLIVICFVAAFFIAVCEEEKQKDRTSLFLIIWLIFAYAASYILMSCFSEEILYLIITALAFLPFYMTLQQYVFDPPMKAFYKKHRQKWGIVRLLQQKEGDGQRQDITSMNWKDNRLSVRFWRIILGIQPK